MLRALRSMWRDYPQNHAATGIQLRGASQVSARTTLRCIAPSSLQRWKREPTLATVAAATTEKGKWRMRQHTLQRCNLQGKVSLQVSNFSSPHFSVKLRAWHRRLREKDRRVIFRCTTQTRHKGGHSGLTLHKERRYQHLKLTERLARQRVHA